MDGINAMLVDVYYYSWKRITDDLNFVQISSQNHGRNVSSGFLLPKMGADVLLQHAAERRPQVVKSPVECVDTMTQCMAAK